MLDPWTIDAILLKEREDMKQTARLDAAEYAFAEIHDLLDEPHDVVRSRMLNATTEEMTPAHAHLALINTHEWDMLSIIDLLPSTPFEPVMQVMDNALTDVGNRVSYGDRMFRVIAIHRTAIDDVVVEFATAEEEDP